MPVRVSDLELLDTITGDEDLILLLQNNDLRRMKSSNLHGRGFVRGTTEPDPDIHPNHPNTIYRDGDFYVMTLNTTEIIYKYIISVGDVPHRFDIIGTMGGSKIHTSGTLGHTNYEELTEFNPVAEIPHGDFYLQNRTGKLFGPMVAVGDVTGIEFDILDHSNWTPMRASTEHRTDVGAHSTWVAQTPANLHLPIDWTMTTHGGIIYDDTTDINPAKSPHHNDTWHIYFDGTHGGWIYRWSQENYDGVILDLSGGDDSAITAEIRKLAWLDGWEYVGVPNAVTPTQNPRQYYRSPIEIIASGIPQHDPLSYIDGDSFYDTHAGERYPSFDGALSMAVSPITGVDWVAGVDDAARLGAAWGQPTSVNNAGTLILNNGVPDINNPYFPTNVGATDNLMMYRGHLLGPYVAGQPTGALSWPILSSMSAPQTFSMYVADIAELQTILNSPDILDTVGLFDDGLSSSVGEVIPAATLIRTGDIIIVYNNFPESKQTWRLGPAVVEYVAADQTTAITWPTIVELTSNRMANTSITGQPTREDNLFIDGDMIITPSGAGYGPYLTEQATDTLAWPLNWSAPQANNDLLLTDTGRGNTTYRILMDDGSIFAEEI